MSHIFAMMKHRIKRTFSLHNMKIAFYILLVSIAAGILCVEIAGLFTEPGSNNLVNMDSKTKDALKAQFGGLGKEDKEALKQQIKEMSGK